MQKPFPHMENGRQTKLGLCMHDLLLFSVFLFFLPLLFLSFHHSLVGNPRVSYGSDNFTSLCAHMHWRVCMLQACLVLEVQEKFVPWRRHLCGITSFARKSFNWGTGEMHNSPRNAASQHTDTVLQWSQLYRGFTCRNIYLFVSRYTPTPSC